MIRVRTRAAWSCSCQDMWNASATQEKSRSRPASGRPGGGTVKCTRMKNRPPGLSPYCWLARMFPECWTRKLDTAYTIPGLSGQESVSTYSCPRAALIAHTSMLPITQRLAPYATMVHHQIIPGQASSTPTAPVCGVRPVALRYGQQCGRFQGGAYSVGGPGGGHPG